MFKYKQTHQLSKRSLKRRLNTETLSENVEICDHRTDSDISNESDDSSVLSDVSVEVPDSRIELQNFLISWSHGFQIRHNALSALLKYLKKTTFPDLPKDARTLLKTPTLRDTVDIGLDGRYVHMGAKTAIDRIMNDYNDTREIVLNLNIDGLPISKSSTSAFWLILGKVVNIENQVPFVIGVYHGYKKPTPFCDFLKPHVEELKDMMQSYVHNGNAIQIKVRAYICDAPARAAVTGSKQHNARTGCYKCTVEGDFINNRMVFLQLNVPLRTNASFRSRDDDQHHRYTSPVEQLDIDMVNAFPLDYLHEVCLGVVKRLLRMWISGDRKSLMPSRTITQISERLINISSSQPSCFQRKVRPLSDFGYFKGSELRTFILYAGPVALKEYLPNDMYEHFLMLHVAITILCDNEKHQTESTLAEALLVRFVENFAEIYGDHHIVYNVHCLVHLVADCQLFGNLNQFSAFPFESLMFKIKQLLHKNNQPLAQLCNRLHEISESGYHQKCQNEPIGIQVRKLK